MNVAELKKVFGALGGLIVAGCGALASLQFLSGPASHDLAVVSAIASGVLVPLGTYLAPKNGPKDPVVVSIDDAIAAVEHAFDQVARVTRAVQAQTPTGTLTYAPGAPGTTVIGGVVEPPTPQPSV